jgi:hypothetical protein
MSWLKRMFDDRYRRARAAEGAGQWRKAAALWAEAGEPGLAADALLHLAERGAATLDERLDAWHDALRWIAEEDDSRRDDIERRMGLSVLQDARVRGAASAEEKRRLAQAAARLERLERPAEAAEAYAMLGRPEDQARCLEAAGDVDKLEALLETSSKKDAREERLRRLMGDYEMALSYGARLEARTALREAVRIAPDERSVAELLRRLEGRMPPPLRVRLSIDGKRVSFVGRLPAVIGRADCDIVVRGTSVSRRHAKLALDKGILSVEDLDSRNGTLIRGVPIAGKIELSGETEIGLGDDVPIRIGPAARSITIEVLGGFDRGEHIVVGEGDLRIEGLPATVRFAEGWAVLAADSGVSLSLEGKHCALPVHLLNEDRLSVGTIAVEVVA